MKRLLTIIMVMLFPLTTYAINKDIAPDPCETPEHCITKIYAVFDSEKRPGVYPSVPVQKIIKKLWSFGDEGMPFIVSLLEEENELIARIGAIALRDIDYIDEKYLPAIIKGVEKNISWLAPALARVGTPEAAEVAVKAYLVSNSAPYNQEAYAIKLFGARILPALKKAINCAYSCNNSTYYLLGTSLESFADNEKSKIAKSVVQIARDKAKTIKVRMGALYVISYLAGPGKVIEDELLQLRRTEPMLAEAVNHTLIGIKSRHAGDVYLDILAERGDINTLVDIAQLGVNGQDAGSGVVKFLDSTTPEAKILAARTLGFIEYKKSVPKLIKLLQDDSNVQLNYVAVESLGRMKDNRAVSVLEDVAENHWHPAVRRAAEVAIKHINSGTEHQDTLHKNKSGFNYFDYEHMGIEVCEEITLTAVSEPTAKKLYRSNAKKQLEKLKYQSVIVSYGARDEAQQKAEDPGGVVEINPDNIVEHRKEVEQTPDVALKVTDGWLVGSNRGEWGGELVHLAINGEQNIILEQNIEDIYKLGDKYIVTTGLAHLFSNRGQIYELYKDKGSAWNSRPWLKLPGSPSSSWFVETEELLINTYGGGSLLLSEDGSFRMAECVQAPE